MSNQGEKTIKLNETFESFEQFNSVFQAYSNATFQKFVKKDSSYLQQNDLKNEELVKRFVLKRATYMCIHSGAVRKNEKKQGLRKRQTKKIGCPCHLRLNFNEKRNLIEITQFVSDHNHSISKELFEEYSIKRKKRKLEVRANDFESSSTSDSSADTTQNNEEFIDNNPSFECNITTNQLLLNDCNEYSVNATHFNGNNQTNFISLEANSEGSIKKNSIKALEAKIGAATKELQSTSTPTENIKHIIDLCDMIKAASEAILALQKIE